MNHTPGVFFVVFLPGQGGHLVWHLVGLQPLEIDRDVDQQHICQQQKTVQRNRHVHCRAQTDSCRHGELWAFIH